MADIQKRDGYTPRRVREQRAYRLVQVGGGAGVAAVAGIVLATIGVIGWTLPVVALLVMVACIVMFRGVTGAR